jgi:fructokinase
MTNNQIAIFGEALFDQFPDGQLILGGAPFNVAWHLQALNQQPCFISRIGNDAKGDKINQAMLDWGMAVENVSRDPDHPTGTVQVSFNDGEPSYAILPDQAYDFIDGRQLDKDRHYNIIYHGTLALRNPVSRSALQQLTSSQYGKIFIDVNLRQPWWHKDEVNLWLDYAHWAKLNDEELSALSPLQDSLPETMRSFLARHRLDVLVVTRGSKGAAAVNQAGEFFEVEPAADLAVVDTVGAGDAFASVLLLGMQYGWPLRQTMERAQSFASALVAQKGATVQDRNFYRPFNVAWNLD